MKQYTAEFLGTFWLVLGGCGSAVLAAAFPERRHRPARRVAGLRPDGADDGLRDRPHLGLPSQSGGVDRPVGRRALSGEPTCCPTSWRRCSAASSAAARALRHRQRQGRLRPGAGGFASNGYGEHSPGGYTLLAALVCEVVMTMFFLIDHPRRHRHARAGGLRADRHRPVPDADPPDQHSGHQHLGEPGAQHRPGAVRRRLGDAAAVAVLGGADRRSNAWGPGLPCRWRWGGLNMATAARRDDSDPRPPSASIRREEGKRHSSRRSTCASGLGRQPGLPHPHTKAVSMSDVHCIGFDPGESRQSGVPELLRTAGSAACQLPGRALWTGHCHGLK